MSEAEQPAPPAEDEKRPFQFGLSTLFVVMTLWAVFCTMAVTFGLGWAAVAAWIPCVAYACYRKQFGLAACLVLLFFLFVYIFPVPPRAREAARRARCTNNLKQIGLALHNYHDVHGCLPPAYIADESGKPMHSWRVLILPELEMKGIYDKYDFDEPWDGPNNSKLHNVIMSCYHCPDDTTAASDTDTNYVVVVGPGTIFPGEEPLGFSDIGDGTSNTIMVVEVANSGIHWMEPRDLHVTQMAPTINPPTGQGISSNHPNLANVAFGDGSVHVLGTKQLTPKQLQALLSRDGGEEVDVDGW